MAAGEREVVTESKVVRRLVVSSIAWLDGWVRSMRIASRTSRRVKRDSRLCAPQCMTNSRTLPALQRMTTSHRQQDLPSSCAVEETDVTRMRDRLQGRHEAPGSPDDANSDPIARRLTGVADALTRHESGDSEPRVAAAERECEAVICNRSDDSVAVASNAKKLSVLAS